MSITYQITDGVRRAKAAQLAGHKSIWARVVNTTNERKIVIDRLLSPRKHIDISTDEKRQRWLNVKEGMAEEPDLFEPINVKVGPKGIPISDVKLSGN